MTTGQSTEKYRVALTVTLDVEGEDREDAAAEAIYRMREVIGDAVLESRQVRVTGVAIDPFTHEDMIFEQP